ncbi:DJ-1/PfpI family protein [Tsukamurella sp. 8F]|uniref:DJ-1/PfpI family protein n=1 Tax=unclassified Tsukamurella TaxID=2633480 RepID=UPI0023B91AA9|nr:MULTISPECIES: DJ-1/PfpI family protein [unclassified Tsukamurella]MDF0529555.1 DJ-1/PfpI family protein [Tsukamurella sp. 8J]MDF0585757.1 DJ-1/PfpI family protein [Tsukamurella sp. 8F]
MTDVVLYVTETMADWEYGFLMAGLAWARENGADLSVATAGEARDPLRSKGGIAVLPDRALDEVGVPDLLILPGAETWGDGHADALLLARRVREQGGTVAAICGATLGLARDGQLDSVDHTSNARDFLAGAAGYRGAGRYREERVVTDGGVITAPAMFPVDFARAVFDAVGAFPPPVLDAWYGLYTTGERRYFDALTSA